MDSQIGTPSKGPGTELAFVWLFTCVFSIVISQTVIASKGLGAEFTLIRFFTFVCLIMAGQLRILSKGLSAQLAFNELITPVRLSIVVHFGFRAGGHGRMVALDWFIPMGYKVAHNFMLISGEVGARTASEQDVLIGFEMEAGLLQQCSLIIVT
uniref:Putative homeobox transcription factor sip1 n=1 Tax=Ixodes ricinus TaxID=34613 RepID=A0A6B0UVV6_IXORI